MSIVYQSVYQCLKCGLTFSILKARKSANCKESKNSFLKACRNCKGRAIKIKEGIYGNKI